MAADGKSRFGFGWLPDIPDRRDKRYSPAPVRRVLDGTGGRADVGAGR